jgi:hypothetical protein
LNLFSRKNPLYLALVHYPVVNRNHEMIASAITNLDLHDLARLACTYDLPACYIVTPLTDQQDLARQLISHWCDGVGKELHPHRGQALERLRIVDDIHRARQEILEGWGRPPLVWATSAQHQTPVLSHHSARQQLQAASGLQPILLLLGTAWGLVSTALDGADAVLEAIPGRAGYNHLSVRCAAAILVDRLFSNEEAH